jgi:outer membrane autotransporter protein
MQSVAEQLSMRADSTRGRMGLASTSRPEGAGGPHMAGQPLQGWVTGYKTWVDMSSDSGFDGYDGDIGGFLIGADMSVAEGILVGIAGGAGNSDLDKDSNSASTETDTVYGSVYVSVGTRDWFADAGLIYGDSSVDLDLGSVFDTEADYDAKNTAIYIGGGKEMIGDYLIITPHVSLLANYYDQDSYSEDSLNAVGRDVESFDELYVQSELGCSVAFYTTMGKLTLKPEFRASWLHEFKADEEDLTYTLIGGTNPYVMTLQAPEEDIIKLGAGISAKLGEYLELRADLDTRQGSEYSDHTVLGSLRYQF